MRFPTKIPTLVGLGLFVLLVGGFIVGFEQLSRLPTLASADITPKNVEVTNVSDTGFTVSWITDSPATGAVAVRNQAQKLDVVFDERDVAGNGDGKSLGKYTTHSVTFRSAGANTSYAMSILSNGKTFTGSAISGPVQTGSTLIGSASDRGPAYGSVTTATGQGAGGALIYLTIEGSQKLSTLVSNRGTWLIPLNLIRSADLTQYLPPKEDRIAEQLTVRLGNEQSSAITDTLNDSPVPEMRLGKSYDFRGQQAFAPNQQQAAPSVTTPKLAATNPSVLGATTVQTTQVTLTKPAQDAVLSSFIPLVQGTGVPGNVVSIVLGITKPFGGSTKVGTDGIWQYTPSRPLDPGKQSVTITSANISGKPVAITRTFEILKSGTQVLGISTPSASLTPTLPATSSPTPTSTLAGQPIPQSGNFLPTLLLLITSIAFITGGVAVVLR